MRQRLAVLCVTVATLTGACSKAAEKPSDAGTAAKATTAAPADRKYLLETVDDAAVVQYYADGFDKLPLREKTLVYHLYRAALAGRDIFIDQKHRNALEMRGVFEAILTHPQGVGPQTLSEIQRYAKLFWLNNGPYVSLTARKFVLNLKPDVWADAAHKAVQAGASFPVQNGETVDALLTRLAPMFLDPAVDPIVTNKTPGPGRDILTSSANNLYAGGVSTGDLKGFTEKYALNSRLVKANGTLSEEVYRVGGRYSAQISEIVAHLDAAIPFAPDPMKNALRALIQWYRTGEDADREKYDIAWVADKSSAVDTINGFIEVYLDPRGVKAQWEGLVFYVNQDKTAVIHKFADNAQWFEDHMPFDAKYRKPMVKGIVANAIDTVVEAGDAGPITPVGINLPNAQKVREQYGSKSVSLSNISEAYDKSTPGSLRGEFSWSAEESDRAGRYGTLAGELLTDMHEVIGHASGQQAPGFTGSPQQAIGEYFSALEEGRADLVGLYFIGDPKLAELGIVPAAEQEAIARTEYESYTRNALVQLRRIRQGTQIEDDHMESSDDRPLADEEHQVDRAADARRQDLPGDHRSGRLPGRCRAAACRSSADQIGGGRRGSEEAVRRLRHPFRCGPARRGDPARRCAQAPVLYRIRAAEADGGDWRRRRDHRRDHLIPDGSDRADARVLGCEEVKPFSKGSG